MKLCCSADSLNHALRGARYTQNMSTSEGLSRWRLVKYAALSAGLGLYFKDCYHVLSVLLEHRAELAETDPLCRDRNTAKVKEYYPPSSANEKSQEIEEISSERFDDRLNDLISEISAADASVGLASLNLERFYEINRESAVFLGGGRAALLQLAHPRKYPYPVFSFTC